MAQKDTLAELLCTQIDADEGQAANDSFKSAQSINLDVPQSWKHDSQASTAGDAPKQPAHKRRRSNGVASSDDVMRNLQAEISQRSCWDVPETSASLEAELVKLVQDEIVRNGKKTSPAEQEGTDEQGTMEDGADGEMERDIAARKVGGRAKCGQEVRLEQEKEYA